MKLLVAFVVSVAVFAAAENDLEEKKTVKRGILGGYGYGGYGYGHYPYLSHYSYPVITKVYGHYGGYGHGYYGGLGHGFYSYYPYYSHGLGHGYYGYHGW